MRKQASDRQEDLGTIPHLAVVATKTPKRITRTLLTTVVIVWLLFSNWSGAQLCVVCGGKPVRMT